MPKGRGKTVNHKGKHRRFTNPEELEEQKKREENERKWREARGDTLSDDESGKSEESGSESEDESSEEGETKKKGVEGLIEIENPNRVQKKTKKLTAINEIVKETKPELSRREREELEKQRAQSNYQRMHAEGKTEEARADLARLAIIKQQREEAAKRREEERKQREAAKQSKTAQMQKALGKKAT